MERPLTDGSWRTLGTLQLSFSRAVRNPRLHLSGLAALATGKGGSTGTASRLTVTGGSPSAPSLVARTDWAGWTVGDNALTPTGTGATDGTTPGSGTLELSGTVSTVTFRVEQRSTARDGSTTAPESPAQAYTVTLDEGVGTAPQGYGNVSHLVSDVFLGRTASGAAGVRPTVAATSAQRLLPPGGSAPQEPAELRERDQPMVELDGGASRRSPWANPAPPELQPGRGEYQGADPTVPFPAEAAIGRYYDLTVPVSPGPGPATLAGWIDFDHNGRFDATERVQSEVLVGAKSAQLEWTVPGNAAAGETWARLRIARNSAQLVTPGGYADSGEVTDQRIKLTVGAARPEITGPVSGAVVADARPEIRGEAGVQGATVAIMAGDTTLCRSTVAKDGRWSCRPDTPLPAGAHTLTPVETTKGGVVLRGEEIRITVKTDPPAAPVLTLPEYTNDPGLLLTGTGDPGSTVSVVDAANAPGAGRIAGELCSTAVAADRSWSCLPVENLADGKHQLTASATDGAGNRTAGKPVPLTVDTVAPPRPVLGSPAAGAELTSARPRLTGRAEPGSTVTVTTRGGTAGERVVLCTAVTGVDGAWSCTPARDLTAGEQSLVVTATDRAGNATSADAVTVTARPVAEPSPSSSPSASASAAASAPAVPSVMPSPSPVLPSAGVTLLTVGLGVGTGGVRLGGTVAVALGVGGRGRTAVRRAGVDPGGGGGDSADRDPAGGDRAARGAAVAGRQPGAVAVPGALGALGRTVGPLGRAIGLGGRAGRRVGLPGGRRGGGGECHARSERRSLAGSRYGSLADSERKRHPRRRQARRGRRPRPRRACRAEGVRRPVRLAGVGRSDGPGAAQPRRAAGGRRASEFRDVAYGGLRCAADAGGGRVADPAGVRSWSGRSATPLSWGSDGASADAPSDRLRHAAH
ncbi:Ig-like domain-containing protein [Kitasatospora gansuensis]